MSAHNLIGLPAGIRQDWQVLVLGDPVAALAQRVEHITRAEIKTLSNMAETFDLITCNHVAHHVADTFDLLRNCARLNKAGGWLLVEAVTVPDDDRAANYIRAFHALRESQPQHFYADYAWRGLLLDAGYGIESFNTSAQRLDLADWAETCSPYVTARLNILLLQAPPAVKDWLRPSAIGSPEASFSQHTIHSLAQKPA